MKILVVDDEEIVRETLVMMIKRLFPSPQAEVTGCDGVIAATQALEQSKFEVVVTDWNMPDGGGQTVIMVAKDAGIASNRIFVVTGSGISPEEAQANIEEASGSRIGGCLLKPVTSGQLKDLLSQVLNI